MKDEAANEISHSQENMNLRRSHSLHDPNERPIEQNEQEDGLVRFSEVKISMMKNGVRPSTEMTRSLEGPILNRPGATKPLIRRQSTMNPVMQLSNESIRFKRRESERTQVSRYHISMCYRLLLFIKDQ